VQQVAIVQRLQAEVSEREVSLGAQRRRETMQVEARELRIEQARVDATGHEQREVVDIVPRHICRTRFYLLPMNAAQHLGAQALEQEARAHVGVVRLCLHERAGSQNGRQRQLVGRDAVVDVAQRLVEHRHGRHTVEAITRIVDDETEVALVDGAQFAGGRAEPHRARGNAGCGFFRAGLTPQPSAFFAIEHVGASHLVVTTAHQGQFDLVLDLFDVQGALRIGMAGQCLHHADTPSFDNVAHTRRGCGAGPFNGHEGLGHGHRDLRWIEGRQGAVAADDLEGQVGRTGPIARGIRAETRLTDTVRDCHRNPRECWTRGGRDRVRYERHRARIA